MSLLRRSWILILTSTFVVSGLSVVGVPLGGSSVAAAAVPVSPEIEAAEQRVIELINERRSGKGLRALRLDPRVAKVARARSQDMIDRHYFSHVDPDGLSARQHLVRAHIKFSRVSEIIAWSQGSDLEASAAKVVQVWMSDAIHRHEVMSTTHNYLGAGVATDGHTITWTVISITGRDRTDPTARIRSVVLAGDQATVRWTGHDPWLVVGTAGLRDYDLARRHPGGVWQTVRDNTTRVNTTTGAQEGTEFRVRARDKAGNTGPWSAIVTASSGTS